MKLGLMDLGSNSARMYLLSWTDGRFEILKRYRVMTRLSEGMHEDGLLQSIPMDRTARVLCQFAEELKKEGATPFAVATAAVRKAKNRDTFLQLVKERAGLSLFVISGETEAYFDFQGVMAGIPHIKNCLICDTGGGSTELILVKDRKMAEKISLPFGAMTLTDTYGQNMENARAAVEQKLNGVPFLKDATGFPLIGIGGSVCALGALDQTLKSGEVNDVHGYEISPKRMKELFDLLASKTPQERMAIGVEKGRADSVCAGFLPSLLLCQYLNSPSLTLCTGGLREGILFELEKENPAHSLKNLEQFLEKVSQIS